MGFLPQAIRPYWMIAAGLLLCGWLAASLTSCKSPLEIDTPRRGEKLPPTEIDDPEFIFDVGDSILARINGRRQVFANEVLRPVWRNGTFDGGYYATVKATSWEGLDGDEYEILSLRLDNVRDTGTYTINSPYSAPKAIDSLGQPRYGASYQRKDPNGFPEVFQSDSARGGQIQVVRIDRERGVMIGTFWFNGYNQERDTVILIDKGAFRLQL
jgi:hypothetical protein